MNRVELRAKKKSMRKRFNTYLNEEKKKETEDNPCRYEARWKRESKWIKCQKPTCLVKKQIGEEKEVKNIIKGKKTKKNFAILLIKDEGKD